MLPLKHKVRREDREGKAHPNNGFVRMGVEIFPSAHAADYSYFKKNQCDRKAASHPLPVLLNLPFKNEDQRNPGSNYPRSFSIAAAAAILKDRGSPMRSSKYWM